MSLPTATINEFGNCSETGKIAYATAADARRHMNYVKKKPKPKLHKTRKTLGELQYYRCEHCHQFHLGHRIKKN